jgi:hypothetical protein
MSFLLFAATSTTVFNPHKGQVLPYARFVVVAIPLVLLSSFYFFVVKRKRDQ